MLRGQHGMELMDPLAWYHFQAGLDASGCLLCASWVLDCYMNPGTGLPHGLSFLSRVLTPSNCHLRSLVIALCLDSHACCYEMGQEMSRVWGFLGKVRAVDTCAPGVAEIAACICTVCCIIGQALNTMVHLKHYNIRPHGFTAFMIHSSVVL